MMKKIISTLQVVIISVMSLSGQLPDALKWHKYELTFTSSGTYENPVQDVSLFEVTFTSPTNLKKTINGFWDGGTTWKARFMPAEAGTWSFETSCSDKKNAGLNGQKGTFICKTGNEQK